MRLDVVMRTASLIRGIHPVDMLYIGLSTSYFTKKLGSQ
jgi:hypothetical protein